MTLQETIEKQGNFLFKYRSYLPILLLLVGFWVYAQNSTNDWTILQSIALLTSLFGLFIRVITVGYTPANTSGRNTKTQVADFLNTSGLYSIVRHPLYLGNFFMYLGIAILTNNIYFILVFVLVFCLYYERIMLAEEAFLRQKFGATYSKWAENRPSFVPNFSTFEAPNLSFSWKKVLKKEKNGFVAVFFTFFLFQYLGNYIKTQSLAIPNNWLTYVTILSVIIYLVLKFIKKRTDLLDEKGR